MAEVQVKPSNKEEVADINAQVKDKAKLMAEMQKATAANDWKLVSKVASEIAKMVATEERAALEAKQKAVENLGMKVKDAITKLLKPMIDKGELDAADGVWYGMDFADQMEKGGERPSSIKLLKSAVKAAKGTGGGGGGKKYSVKTEDLLVEHGSKVMNAENGQTYQQAYDANTEGNSRYQVRVKLLKVAGIS